MRKTLVPALLCVLLSATSAGCFGKFALTRKFYGFNEHVSSDKFVRSIATWAMIIIPVYEVGGLVDFLLLNPIEFWTGSNPLHANERGDGSARLAVVEQPDGSATFDSGEGSYRLVRSSAGRFELERDGVSVGTAEVTDDGGLILLDARGNVTSALSAAEIDAADAALLAMSR